MVAKALAQGTPQRGIPTLGTAPMVREDAPAPSFDGMSYEAMDAMPLDQQLAMLRKASMGS